MVSFPFLALASSMAALKVHSPAVSVWHTPSPSFSSSSSPVELTTKVVAAWAGFTACKPNNKRRANIIAAPKANAVTLSSRFVLKKKKLVLIGYSSRSGSRRGIENLLPCIHFYYDRYFTGWV
jgi:hypothetical protein